MSEQNIIKDALANSHNRRSLVKKLAFAGAALGAVQLPAGAQAIAPSDVVQFALNLEYLEAEFYSCAATGQPLPSDLRGGGPASTGCQKARLGPVAQVWPAPPLVLSRHSAASEVQA